MKDFNTILAEHIGCKPEEIVDTLFPIERGYSEEERVKFYTAIICSMGYVEINTDYQEYFSDE